MKCVILASSNVIVKVITSDAQKFWQPKTILVFGFGRNIF